MCPRTSGWLTPHRQAPRGPFWVVGVPSARGYCSHPRALSPEHSCTDLWGTEHSGAATRSPEHSCMDLWGTERSGDAARSPEHSLPKLSSSNRQGTRVLGGNRAPPRALSSRYLDSVDHRGTGVLGSHQPWPQAPSPRTWPFLIPQERPRGMAPCDGWLASLFGDPRFLIQ